MAGKDRLRKTDPFARKPTFQDMMDETVGGDERAVEIVEKVVEVEKIVEVVAPAIIHDGQNGITWVGNIGISPVGMYTNGDISEDEWVNFLPAIKQIKSAYQWIIGDWAAYGETVLGKTYEEIGQLTGYQPKTVEVYASVCRNVDKLIRINSLHFSHHQLVAGLDQESQAYWLNRASEGRWSKRKLEAMMAGGDETIITTGNTSVDRFQRAFTPFQSRISKIVKKAAPEHRKQMADWLRDLADKLEKGRLGQ